MIPENYPWIDEVAVMDQGELESKEDEYGFMFEYNRVNTGKDQMSTKERELQKMRE